MGNGTYGAVERRSTQVDSPVRSIAHHAVEGGPNGREHTCGRSEGRLLEGEGFSAVGGSCLCVMISENLTTYSTKNVRLVEYPTAEPNAMGRRIEPGRLPKMASGRVSEGM